MRVLVLVFLVACSQSPNNAGSNPSDSSLVNLSLPLKSPWPRLSFHLASVLPQFGDEPGFRELESYSIRCDPWRFYSYSIYQLPKQKVEELLAKNPIVVMQYANGKKLYAKLEKIKIDSFTKKHIEPDELEIASDFYSMALNKRIDIYSYYSGSHLHYLFFDTVSNMVFHRLMLITF